jgi:hypothetical protein
LSKIVSTTTLNAGFLAIVFLAGTFAAISPSFMIGAHAQQYGMDQQKYNNYDSDYGMNRYDDKQSYGKDSNSYDKSKDSITIVKKIKCNNINVNVNGFNGIEIGTLSTALSGLATEAQEDEGEVGTSSFGSDGGSGSDGGGRPSGSNTDSRICINNNNFNVVEAETPTPEPTCEECFHKFLIQEQINAFLAFKSFANLEELCFDLDKGETSEGRFIEDLGDTLDIPEQTSQNLVDCLKSIGIIFLE